MSENEELEIRLAVWQTICDAADALHPRCTFYSSEDPDPRAKLVFHNSIAAVPTWKLIEVLSLVALLKKAERINSTQICNVFGRTKPIEIIEDGQRRYVWGQSPLRGERSELGGRPDLVVTSTSQSPSATNIQRVIECKCQRQIGAQAIRAEFGKAHDLRATAYLIWSFYKPSQAAVDGARGLGIDLVGLDFDTPEGRTRMESPELLLQYVAETLQRSRRESRFAQMLQRAATEVSTKLPPPDLL